MRVKVVDRGQLMGAKRPDESLPSALRVSRFFPSAVYPRHQQRTCEGHGSRREMKIYPLEHPHLSHLGSCN